ncbi:bifunctional metallophosphatase/5'-nucleotidase [Aerococcus kribbianus]|uniref:Bifunctional UDP-sugar hydrolase/5'-nucleotidase n=1 Tax=Aerococcus kribbianus TaxID=2999064 RepID=A0A9X3JCU8_9LACT|nr:MULTISPECIES: bifunctional UDP-sugar hydrolase/5'-nucleotidase [unclassified Aerococcus]MCZ0716840.1 bifunctional UDP-sugar hydrolase/5'-nucleotidase [Aerococcus sp. YH-aer221]MCZ0725128.1 bifunctional UDP-sugar hydrolase/5'-nucleotidase [Aerococcus sp. YH-aer222]
MQITLLATSDVHGYITADSFQEPGVKLGQGYSRAISVIEAEREKAPGPVLYIDNGDFIQGSPLAAYYHDQASVDRLISAANLGQADLAVIGNHEFNYGLERLDQAIEAAQYPILCANILRNGQPLGQPYKIYDFDHVKIGVLGLTTAYIPHWEQAENIVGLSFQSALEAAQKWVPHLKNNLACDLVVISYHGGFERDLETDQKSEEDTGENEGWKLLNSALPIDALITGHQHRQIAGVKNGIPTIQPGSRGEFVGKITLEVEDKQVKDAQAELLVTADSPESDTISNSFQDEMNQVNIWLDQVLGGAESDFRVNNIASAQINDHPFAQLLNQIACQYMNNDVSATVFFGPDVKGFHGQIRRRDVLNNYPFPNTLVNVRLKGSELRDILEKNAAYFDLDDQGQVVISEDELRPKMRVYNFDFYYGIHYNMDISQAIGQRIGEIKKDDQTIGPDDEITVTVNNYRAVGGGDFPHFSMDKAVTADSTTMPNLIMDYIEKENQINLNFTPHYHVYGCQDK